MKNISVYYNGNEITFENTIWGREIIYYNNIEMSNLYSTFGKTHQIIVREDDLPVEYLVRTGMNGYGIVCNIWRNGQPLLKEFSYAYEKALRKLSKKKRPPRKEFHNSPTPPPQKAPLYKKSDFV